MDDTGSPVGQTALRISYRGQLSTSKGPTQMKAAVISELGETPVLSDLSEPTGETVHRILAVSLNPIDIAVGAGRFFGGHPELPFVPGCEGVGRAPDGTRVYLFSGGLGLSRDGLLAERVAARSSLGYRFRTRSPTRLRRRAASPAWRAGCPSPGGHP